MPPHIPWGAEHGQVQRDLHGATKVAELRGRMVGCPVASWPADSPRAYDDGKGVWPSGAEQLAMEL